MQVRVQLDALAADCHGRVEVAIPAADQDLAGGKRRQQRIRLASAIEHGYRFVEASERAVEHAETHIGRAVRGLLLQRPQKLGFGIVVAMLEHVKTEGTVAAEFRPQSAEHHGLLMRLDETRIHLEWRPRAENRECEVRRGEPFEGAEVRRTFADRPLEAVDRVLAADARALMPVVPPLPDEIIGSRYFERVSEFGPMNDPAAVLAEMLADLADGDVHRVPRYVRALPRVGNHRVVADEIAAVLEQHTQRLKHQRSQANLGAVARQSRAGDVEHKRAEDELGHAARLL